jgi:hypothetical protein
MLSPIPQASLIYRTYLYYKFHSVEANVNFGCFNNDAIHGNEKRQFHSPTYPFIFSKLVDALMRYSTGKEVYITRLQSMDI